MAVKVARRAKPIRKQPQLGKVGRKAGPPPQRHPPGIQRVKALARAHIIKKTKFQTLTNQQNANVSQYTAPAAHDIQVKNIGVATSGMVLPDGVPYAPGATYQFHGDGTYTKIRGPMDEEEEQ